MEIYRTAHKIERKTREQSLEQTGIRRLQKSCQVRAGPTAGMMKFNGSSALVSLYSRLKVLGERETRSSTLSPILNLAILGL